MRITIYYELNYRFRKRAGWEGRKGGGGGGGGGSGRYIERVGEREREREREREEGEIMVFRTSLN